MRAQAIAGLAAIARPRVLVVGDLILDHYVWGAVDRISPEAPIQVLVVREEEDRLGGAGNVAANLATLEAQVSLLGVLGEDDDAGRYVDLCRQAGIRVHALRAGDRPTTRKSRYIAHSQQVLRVDREEVWPVPEPVGGELLRRAEELLPETDVVLLSDYAKGVLSAPVLQRIIRAARERKIRVIIDPKGSDFARYRGASIITPNRREASMALGRPLDDRAALIEGMAELRRRLELEAALVTLGPEGMACLPPSGEPIFISARAQAVFDVSGAGDTVLAVLGLFLGAGRPLAEAVEAANAAGGVVVGKLGTAQASREEIRRALSEGDFVEGGKLIEREALAELLEDLRAQGRRIVFTNGCFDLLHPGHVRYLTFARSQGDLLIVGLNSDASVRGLKGPGRPLVDQAARAEVLCGLESVDYVVIFDEPDPHDLVARLQPDVLVKGADWKDKGVVGADVVEARGGQVILCPLVEGFSTTRLVERIVESHASGGAVPPRHTEARK